MPNALRPTELCLDTDESGANIDARDGVARMNPLAYLDWSAPASRPGFRAVTLCDRELAVATGQGPDRRTALHALWIAADLGEDQHTFWVAGEYLVLTGTYPDRLRS